MEIIQINTLTDKLSKMVSEHHLNDVFKELLALTDKQKNILYLKDKVYKQAEIYTNLLRYSFNDVKDPDRDKVYSKLLKSLYGIIDEVKTELVSENKHLAINTLNQVTQFNFSENKEKISKAILSDIPAEDVNTLFCMIWVSNLLKEQEVSIIEKVLENKKTSWINEALIVSALSISNLMFFDEQKIEFLFRFYQKGKEKVWQRSLVGIVLNVYFYSNRLTEYPLIMQQIEEIKKDKDFYKNLQYVIHQIIRTRETEKISRKLHDEIIPEVAKFKPKIEERLKLDDIFKDSLSEDKNPDWEAVFEDSPELFNKLEEISKLQIEGSDVFMSAFAFLKHFDFFKKPAHWFLPFYKENPETLEAFEFEKEGFNSGLFLEGLERSAFLCNSDKYSFIMNIRFMPEMQKNMMLEMFNAELESMNELIKDEEILRKTNLDKYIINQYIQDLYRFYKLYPGRNDFFDIFSDNLEVYNCKILKTNWYNVDLYKSIGNLYFKKDYFADALIIYKIIFTSGLNEQDIFEKIAYSYQKTGQYDQALEYYTKAELFDSNKNWTLKKIALCYREQGNNEKALEYYLKAEHNEPENLYIQANIGHTYLRMKDFENALKHYYKVEYFSPSNTMILRPIAWCSYVTGKFETSLKYYQKLVEKGEADYYDYLNMGHVNWCSNKVEKATEIYKKSIGFSKNEGKSLRKDFLEDKEYLLHHGIKEFEIELMIDYIFLDLAEA